MCECVYDIRFKPSNQTLQNTVAFIFGISTYCGNIGDRAFGLRYTMSKYVVGNDAVLTGTSEMLCDEYVRPACHLHAVPSAVWSISIESVDRSST